MVFLIRLLHLILFSVLLCFVHTSFRVASASRSLSTDRETLISFRSQIDLDPRKPLFSWNLSVSPCNWPGVSCDIYNRRVVSLNLSGSRLTGSISPSIGNLSFLRSLQLQNNRLKGSIPNEISSLFRLRVLNMSSNSLEGSLPSDISKLVELRVLNLMSNKIAGRVPDELGGLTNLQVLNLGRNLLHGPIPSSVSNISSLTTLNLGTNSLSGPIPSDLSRLRRLQVLDLTINNLTGTVPPAIYNMSSLLFLALAKNNLWGEIPSNVGDMLPNLLVFNFCFNKFTGGIPGSLHNLTNIEVIRMAHNLLEGTVPPGLGSLPFLQMYSIGRNKLVWSRDNGLDHFIASLTNSPRLNFLAFDGNLLEGVLPESVGNLSKDLSKLYKGGNRISGKILASIGQLTGLTLLNMSYNSLSGEIPREIMKLQELQVLNLAGNQLVGSIPESFGNLRDLNDIDLSGNKLEGSIPASFGNFRGLLFVDLSNNRLNGSIPREILNLPSLSAALNLSKNVLSGPVPQDIGRLESLFSIDLSDNQLSGNIPLSIRHCKSLEKLDMARNLLSGLIPDTLVEVKGLETLDLSSNQLSGVIPLNLQDLRALRFLNLSFNNLEGGVPNGGAFRNISNIHLEGNPKLCLQAPCQKARGNGKLLKMSIVVGVVAVLALCLVIFLFLFSRKRKAKLIDPACSFKEPFMTISYDELRRATDNFGLQNLIGTGSFGFVFKGYIREGVAVAVKVIDIKTSGYYKSFLAECEALRNVRHRNLVKLITTCSSVDFKNAEFLALVYEFLGNGSLDNWIRGKKKKPNGHGLNLEERVGVAIDIASALDYLHSDCNVPVVHCDLKPSNILLDEEMAAKVGDFGLARLLMDTAERQASISSSHVLKGSIGYIPPEYGFREKPSTAGDVYSFGVMLLELFSGKSPTHESFAGNQNLIRWVNSAFPENVIRVIDPELVALMGESRTYELTGVETQVDCLVSVIGVGLACTVRAADERIAMRDAICRLKGARNALLKSDRLSKPKF